MKKQETSLCFWQVDGEHYPFKNMNRAFAIIKANTLREITLLLPYLTWEQGEEIVHL